MKRQRYSIFSVAVVLLMFLAQPVQAGTTEQLIQLQTTVQMLHDKMDRIDERMGVLKDQISQQTDTINKMNAAVQNMEKVLGQQNTDAASKVDKLAGQVRALRDSVERLKERQVK
jgi:methyl-accepting chemotaxis protein